MTTTNTSTASAQEWERRSRSLRSAFDLASSAAKQMAALALYLEVKYDPNYRFPDDLALVYNCIVAGGGVEAHVFLDYREADLDPGALAGTWMSFSRSPEWDGTVESTLAALRSEELSNLVCDVRLAHYMSQAAVLAARTSTQGDAA